MTRARAPGKVVLSGAYAVLEGAPAIVASVDRYVVADTARRAALETPEVKAALGEQAAPWFDASALREGGRKLGLGSSAAILVASLGAIELARNPRLGVEGLRSRVFRPALAAHARAQGGGSGVDVAASCYGGVLVARRRAGELELQPAALPAKIRVRVLAASHAASTPGLIQAVYALQRAEPERFRELLGRQATASRAAVTALRAGDAAALVSALREQCRALAALGEASAVPIVTPEVAELARHAPETAAVLPSGAGGGDLALWVSTEEDEPPPGVGLDPLDLDLGAPGLEPCSAAAEALP